MSQKFYSEVTLEALNNATTDTDHFLVGDSGTIKYRTGAQVLSDIGGQAALTNPITGTGTTNYVSKFTGTTTLGNSQIFDNGTNVGIGTTSPPYKFSVYDTSDGVVGHFGGGVSNYTLISFRSNEANVYSTSLGSYNSGMLFRTGATDRMYINSSGNVGIGTTSPLNKFVVSNNNYNGLEFIPDNGSGMSQIFSFNRTLSAWSDFALYSSNLIFNTNGSDERMRITSSGNVGIGTTTANYRTQIETTGADVFLTKNTSSTSFNRSYFYNNNNVGVQFLNFGSAYGFGTEFGVGQNGSVIQSNTTSAFAVGTSGAYPLLLGTNGTERMRILSGGNVGIGTTSPAYKTDIVGNLRFSTGYLNSDNCFERVFSDAIVFANGTANLAADVILGNSNFWGYIEVEVTSTFNNQSSPGKLTKIFAAGVTPNNNIYANESRVSDAMGPVPNNVAIGDLSWDATNSRYRIPISHIVSTGNTYTVKVRMFTANASSSTGAKGVFDSISIGSTYTLTALSRQYPYYNNKLSIGTSSASAVLTLQNESGAYGTSYPFKMLSYAGTNIFRSYMDGNWNYVNEVFQIGGNSCGYIISTNSSERMRITSTGNVGIGTSSPSNSKLVVSGASASAGIMSIDTSSTTSFVRILGDISSQNLINWQDGTALRFATSTQAYGSFAERMRITSAGNVGIGTSSPSQKLDVAGDALINGLTVGTGPGNDTSNTVLGENAFASNSIAMRNVAIGASALSSLTINGKNVAIGFAALGSTQETDYSIAIGSRCADAVSGNVRGLTAIGTDMSYDPSQATELGNNCLAISQYDNTTPGLPHFYAPAKIVCPNGNTVTDVLSFDYTLYTAVFMDYSIYNDSGDQFRAGTYTIAMKISGTDVTNDDQTVVYSGTTLSATFIVSISGNIATIQIRNQDSDNYNFRFTSRLLMR